MAVITKRINKKGTGYLAVIRKKGYKTICKTFEKKTDAVAWASDIESQINKGIYKEDSQLSVADCAQNKITVMSELIDYFEQNVAPKRYTDPEKYTTMYNWWRLRIGKIKVKDLSAAILSSAKQVLVNEKIIKCNQEVVRKDNTINKYLLCISAVLTHAVKELEIIDVNPMHKVKLMPKTKGRTRFLSIDEISKLLGACKEHSSMIYIFVLIAISTGARYSEVQNLKCENIDYNNNQLHFLDTKNKEHRGVPVDAEILELMKEYLSEREIETGYVFINKKKAGLAYIRGILREIIHKLKLEDFRIHDMRHTTASYIAMNGGSLLDIAEILGHKSLVMARRYSHLTQKHTAAVLHKVTNKILPDL